MMGFKFFVIGSEPESEFTVARPAESIGRTPKGDLSRTFHIPGHFIEEKYSDRSHWWRHSSGQNKNVWPFALDIALAHRIPTLTRAPVSVWIFHDLVWGVFEHPPPPTTSAPRHRRKKRKKAMESSSKIITNLLQSFFTSGQYWGHQRSLKKMFWKCHFFQSSALFRKITKWE